MREINNNSSNPGEMFFVEKFSDEKQGEIDTLLPPEIKNLLSSKEKQNLQNSPNPISFFLDNNLEIEGINEINNKYRFSLSFDRINIEVIDNNLGLIWFPIDYETKKIKMMVSNLSQSVISVLYDELRNSSSFFRTIFEMTQIPFCDENTRRQADLDILNKKQIESKLIKIKPEKSGVCSKIEIKELDEENTTVVGQKGYAIGHPSIPGSKILQTYGLADCVALIGYSPLTKKGFLSHIDRADSVAEALKLIRWNLGNEANLIIYGGAGEDYGSGGSRTILDAVYSCLGEGDLKIIGQETLGRESRSIALDTENGQIFIPKKIKIEDDVQKKIIEFRVLYDQRSTLTNDGKKNTK